MSKEHGDFEVGDRVSIVLDISGITPTCEAGWRMAEELKEKLYNTPFIIDAIKIKKRRLKYLLRKEGNMCANGWYCSSNIEHM